MDDGVIVATLRLTEKDLEVPIIEMSALFRLRRPLTGVLGLGIVSVLAMKQASSPWSQTLAPLVFSALFLVMLYVSPRRAARRILAALTRAGDSSVSYRFDDEGVTIRAAGSTSSFAYRSLAKASEGTTAFLLYVNPLVANIVPKRAFAADDVARVRAYIDGHVKTKPLRTLPWKTFVFWMALVFAFVVVWQFLNAAPR